MRSILLFLSGLVQKLKFLNKSISSGERAPPLKKQLFQSQIQQTDKKLKPHKHALPAYHKIKTKINYYKQIVNFSRLILAKMTTA
jgi:hypothetical protein